MKVIITALCLLALTVSIASAATINMNYAALGANGWTASVQQSASGHTRGALSDNSGLPNYGGVPGLQFTADAAGTNKVWSGIGSDLAVGYAFSDFNTLAITTYGFEGDNVNYWTCPTFCFSGQKAAANVSTVTLEYLPWLANPAVEGQTTKPATARPSPVQGWHTYNALTQGCWYLPSYGYYYSAAGFLASSRKSFYFISGASGVSGKSFNVGLCQENTSDDPGFFSSARGEVSSFTVGINGVNGGAATTYILSVPEPGSIIALMMGVVGFIGLRRKH